MDRRSFLISAAIGSPLLLRHTAFGQNHSTSAQVPGAEAQQSKEIRAAAMRLNSGLASEHQGKLTFAFPAHEQPTIAKFTPHGNPGGPDRGRAPDGHQDGPGERNRPIGANGPGSPRGPGGPAGFAFTGEKYGESMWTNFPVSDVPRPGLRMGALNDSEKKAVHDLLQTVLSPMGYRKVLDIMAADQKLAEEGTNYAAGLDAYTVALFGQPSPNLPWMLQFGGHHLGLNVTFVGDEAVCAPLHTGILPSKFYKDGEEIRGLGRENDKAFDLVATLSPDQLKAARIDHDISDLVFGPGHPDAELAPSGLRGSAMTEQQRGVLFSVVSEWAGMLNHAHSSRRLDILRRSLPECYFAWSGPTTHEPDMNGESYFRIHGPTLLIEHAPQGNQGGYKLHVHTVMRDLGNDYAKQLL